MRMWLFVVKTSIWAPHYLSRLLICDLSPEVQTLPFHFLYYLRCTCGHQKGVCSSRVVVVMHGGSDVQCHELQGRNQTSQGTIALLEQRVHFGQQKSWCPWHNAVYRVWKQKIKTDKKYCLKQLSFKLDSVCPISLIPWYSISKHSVPTKRDKKTSRKRYWNYIAYTCTVLYWCTSKHKCRRVTVLIIRLFLCSIIHKTFLFLYFYSLTEGLVVCLACVNKYMADFICKL